MRSALIAELRGLLNRLPAEDLDLLRRHALRLCGLHNRRRRLLLVHPGARPRRAGKGASA